MVVSTLCLKLVAVPDELLAERLRVGDDLLRVRLPCRRCCLLERGCDTSDGLEKRQTRDRHIVTTTDVVVGATLARREHSVIHTFLEVLRLLGVLPEENQAGTGATERLVSIAERSANRLRIIQNENSRRGRDNVTVLERIRELARRHETTGVRDVSHQESAVLVHNGAERRVVPVPRVRRCAANNQLRLEDLRLRRELLVVDKLRRRVEPVREGLEVDGRRRHLLLCSLLAGTSVRQ